jgi:cytochrome c oxidase assembly protein Cox11
MSECVFRINKNAESHGDLLAAVGLADLLASSTGIGTVTLTDLGAVFEVRLSRSWDDRIAASLPQDPGYPFLKANAKVVVPPGAQDVVDYQAEKAKADRQRKLISLV